MTRNIGPRGGCVTAAIVVCLAMLLPAWNAFAQATDARLQETRERIARGETLYNAEDFAGALSEFERAYELLEGHPMQDLATYNVGRCYERLFRYDQAMIFYRRYLEQAGPDAEDRAEVQAKIELLTGLLATLRLTVNVGAYEVWVDDRNLGANLTEVMVPGGAHVVEIRATGYAPSRQQVNAPSRTEQTLTFTLEELGEYEGLHWAYFAVSTGLAVATVAVAAVFGGMAMSESDDLQTQLEDPIQGWLVTQADLDHVSTLALTADILYGTAALFAVAAIVLAFFTNWGNDDGEDAVTPTASRFRLSPVFGQGLGGLSLEGRF